MDDHPAGRRALFLTSNFPRWSGDSTTPFVLHLAQDLQELGWGIDVLAPHAPGAQRGEMLGGIVVERFRYLLPETSQTVCYGGGALVNLRKSRVNAAKLPALVGAEWAAARRRLRSGRYALLHSHWVLPQGFVGTFAARAGHVPHIVTVHGGDVFGLQSRALAPFKRYALRAADAVTVNSSATDRAVRALAPELSTSLHRAPMGVDTRPADPAEVGGIRRRFRRPAGPLLVFVGRLVEEKGVEDVVRAVAHLAPRRPDTTAVLVGDGQDRLAVERLVARLGVSDRVTLVGWVDSAAVPGWLAAADIVLAPSRIGPDGWMEAQGLSIVEALAASRPVVASDVGGIPDTVTDGETGLLVPQRDPAALAAAVDRLCDDPELAARLGARGRQVALARFSRAAAAKRFAALYDSLAGADLTARGRRRGFT